ncbi:hypothetical protein IWQ60_011294 [Tieghemiomyces parasiticus]|uniref:Gamma-soluble NSF attachment protein n=1 Tax=Tieghemiomyces parasiticus TaxID=78921 RepID=A0A9W8DLP4_9FUNG|nr:hypothetical protein IWQ60_011294 [Tieghemiomyces parasiticus]
MADANLRRGADYMADAHKYTKSGWFRKPEWDIAAQLYEKAANAFKAARSHDNAIRAYQQSADALAKFGSMFLAGKALENAGNLAQQSQDQLRAIELYTRASDLYIAHGSSPDKAAGIVEKAAQLCEPLDPDRALDLYKQSANIYEAEDRERMSIETLRNAAGCAVRHRRFPEALFFLGKLAKASRVLVRRSESDKAHLCIVIVALAMGDSVEARKRLDGWLFAGPEAAPSGGGMWGNVPASTGDVAPTPEAAVGQALVDAFEHWDAAQLQEIRQDPRHAQTLEFLPSEVAKLAHHMSISGVKAAENLPPTGTTTGAPAAAPAFPVSDPTPDDDDDLC